MSNNPVRTSRRGEGSEKKWMLMQIHTIHCHAYNFNLLHAFSWYLPRTKNQTPFWELCSLSTTSAKKIQQKIQQKSTWITWSASPPQCLHRSLPVSLPRHKPAAHHLACLPQLQGKAGGWLLPAHPPAPSESMLRGSGSQEPDLEWKPILLSLWCCSSLSSVLSNDKTSRFFCTGEKIKHQLKTNSNLFNSTRYYCLRKPQSKIQTQFISSCSLQQK